jgi:CubicO group peptidase (beta-lactamase class C family)
LGHSGWGGSFAFGDPEAGLALAYTMNQMGAASDFGDPRALGLVEATYGCL